MASAVANQAIRAVFSIYGRETSNRLKWTLSLSFVFDCQKGHMCLQQLYSSISGRETSNRLKWTLSIETEMRIGTSLLLTLAQVQSTCVTKSARSVGNISILNIF